MRHARGKHFPVPRSVAPRAQALRLPPGFARLKNGGKYIVVLLSVATLYVWPLRFSTSLSTIVEPQECMFSFPRALSLSLFFSLSFTGLSPTLSFSLSLY